MAVISLDIVREYGREVRDASLTPTGILELPHGFLGEEWLPPLWVHPNYLLLEEFLLRNTSLSAQDAPKRPRVRRKRQFHLVATPGIGKTYFGHYWFFKQAKAGKKLIWRNKAGTFLYYDFSLQEPFVQASSIYIVPETWDSRETLAAIWLIVDGRCTSANHSGLVLQCVSPARSGYIEFAKDVGMRCSLEAWTLEELLECKDAVGFSFTDDEMRERFFYCGGVPREVLDETKSVQDLKSLMREAVSRAPSWEAVIQHAASGVDKNPLISDYLLHYQLVRKLDLNDPPSDCVLHYVLKFGSEFVKDLVVDEYQKEGHAKVRRLFDFMQEVDVAHGLSGEFFQMNVHRRLEDGGGDYRVKDLISPDNPIPPLSLKPSSSKRLRRWEIAPRSASAGPSRRPSKAERQRGLIEVQFSVYGKNTPRASAALGREEGRGLASLPRGCFISPYSATFKSLDSFIVPDTMLQCTYSLEHPVFWAPILEIVREYDRWHSSQGITPPEYYSLIFIVPESQFGDFKFQAYKREDGSAYERLPEDTSRVRQFALAFPW